MIFIGAMLSLIKHIYSVYSYLHTDFVFGKNWVLRLNFAKSLRVSQYNCICSLFIRSKTGNASVNVQSSLVLYSEYSYWNNFLQFVTS